MLSAESSTRHGLRRWRVRAIARIPEVLADPEPDRTPAGFVPVVHREGPAGAVRRDQPDQGLHRQGDGAPVPGLRVRRPEVLRGGVPDQGPDLQQAAVRERRAPDQGDRRDPAPAGLHGRLPVDDRPGHVRDQRRRARRRQPARPLAGRLLQRARGPGVRPDALQRQGHPEPRRLARVRDRTTRTSCGSRSIASARSRRRPCSAPSATRRTTRSPALFSGDRHRPRAPVHSPTRSTRTSPTPSTRP